MEIYIMTDMEGASGILDSTNWCWPNGRYYDEGRELLTMEVNAAIEGFLNAGATGVTVVDGHGYGGVKHSLLHTCSRYSRGWQGPYPFALDKSYAAVAFVGQHAKAGTPGAHLPHTGNFSVLDYTVNNCSLGEFGQFSSICSFLGVPVIFASGDEALACEAKSLIPGITTAAVKQGVCTESGENLGTESYAAANLGAIHLHPLKARELIRHGAYSALLKLRSLLESGPEALAGFFVPEGLQKAPFQAKAIYRKNGGGAGETKTSTHESDIVAMFNGMARA